MQAARDAAYGDRHEVTMRMAVKQTLYSCGVAGKGSNLPEPFHTPPRLPCCVQKWRIVLPCTHCKHDNESQAVKRLQGQSCTAESAMRQVWVRPEATYCSRSGASADTIFCIRVCMQVWRGSLMRKPLPGSSIGSTCIASQGYRLSAGTGC